MRTEITKIYTFDELSKDRQDEVIQNFIDSREGYIFEDMAIGTLNEFAKTFNVSINDYCFSYSGYRDRYDGVDFYFKKDIEHLKGLRLYKYLVNNFKGIIDKYDLCNLTGYYIDIDILHPLYDFIKNPKLDKSITELFEECFEAWLEAIRQDIRYMDTYAYVKEEIMSNDGFEFYEDGRQYF